METNFKEFTTLIDSALGIAEQMQLEQPGESLETAIRALQSVKDQALAGQLAPSQGTTTLGLARGMADWIESLDSPLLKAVGAIEEYYKTNL
jgi:hypothetical protein